MAFFISRRGRRKIVDQKIKAKNSGQKKSSSMTFNNKQTNSTDNVKQNSRSPKTGYDAFDTED